MNPDLRDELIVHTIVVVAILYFWYSMPFEEFVAIVLLLIYIEVSIGDTR